MAEESGYREPAEHPDAEELKDLRKEVKRLEQRNEYLCEKIDAQDPVSKFKRKWHALTFVGAVALGMHHFSFLALAGEKVAYAADAGLLGGWAFVVWCLWEN